MPPRKSSKNVEMLGVVAKGLKGLKEKVVFVGGATIDLYIDDAAAPETRPTDDVDCVVELGSKIGYHDLEQELRILKFEHPMAEKGPICRWKFCGIKVDIMPTDGQVLGFKNQWYSDGMAHAEQFELRDGQKILVFSLPHLLASKLEAFRDRGHGDFLGSSDIEDIFALIDGCSDAETRIARAPKPVLTYLADELSDLLKNDHFLLSVDGNLGPSGRAKRGLELMHRIVSLRPAA